MPALILAAYVAFGFSGIGLLVALSLESVVMIVGAVQMAAVAIFFLGMSRIVELLSSINAALVPTAQAPAAPEPDAAPASVRSPAEISADIERMRAKT